MSHPVSLFGRRSEARHPRHCLRSAPCSLSPKGGQFPPAEPSSAELNAIEAEWPLIAAEVALVDAECAYAIRPSASTRAAVRAAEAAVIRAYLAHTRNTTPPSQGEAA